jgi:integrase/recombinase XerD
MPNRRPAIHVEVVRAWLVTFRSTSTRAAYERDLELYVEWLASRGVLPFEATTKEFADYRNHYEKVGSSAATVQRRLASVSSFYRFAVDAHHIDDSPASGPRRVDAGSSGPVGSATESLSAEERKSLWSCATTLGPRSAALVGLMLFDGLKLFEALSLNVADVSRRSARETGDGGLNVSLERRGAVVSVALDDRTEPAVQQMRRGRAVGPLFVGESMTVGGARLTRFGADYLLKQVGAAALLPAPLTANRLRSTHISEALKHADAESVRDAVGHVDRRTTLRFRSAD